MSLEGLPSELIVKILDLVNWTSCENFSRTSRRNHALALPHLQREVVLLSQNGRTLRPQHADVGACLRRATSVVVASPDPDEAVGGSFKGRCPACNLKDNELDHKTGEPLIHKALENCRTGRLKKFTWLLGVCVQEDILGANGVLPTRQFNLEELHLVTCYHRLGLRCQTRKLDLMPFSKLHTLSWTGIHRSQFRVVQAALSSLAKQLVSLELDYLSSTTNRDPEVDQTAEPGDLTPFFLDLRGGGDVAFPKLESLSFTNVVVETSKGGELAAALNLHRLRSLTLKQCPGWKTLLAGMQNEVSEGPFPLLALEVHSFPREDERDSVVGAAIARALRLCPDLEELRFYKVNGTASFPDMGVLQQKMELPKLKRVVVHEGSPLTGTLGRWRPPPEVMDQFGPEFVEYNVLSHSKIEFLGHAGSLDQVKMLLDESTRIQALANLKVIHVRQDHEEVSDFRSHALGRAVVDPSALGVASPRRMLAPEAYHLAAWAFTTRKLPSLELLAFGDFGSLDPRFRVLLCRSGHPRDPFRLVREEDCRIIDLLGESVDSMVVGPSYSRPYLRSSGASLAGNVWRGGLGRRLARESGEREPTKPYEMEGPFSYMIPEKVKRVLWWPSPEEGEEEEDPVELEVEEWEYDDVFGVRWWCASDSDDEVEDDDGPE